MNSKVVAAACLASMLLLSAPLAVFGAEPAALRVIVVRTDNPDAYVRELEKGKALLKRLGSSAQLRVWRARFAGENAGAVVVSLEFPNLAAIAKDDGALAGDAEFQSWLKGLDKVRKVVSDSLYQELKP